MRHITRYFGYIAGYGGDTIRAQQAILCVMNLNANFKRRAVVHADRLPWVTSPMPGVDRRMLERIGDEVARATSIVRYAPGSAFSPHVHTGGEEFLVLDGVFQDEHGNYPVGSYIRNPPRTSHTPASETGCTIFVKLWQFEPGDHNSVRVDTAAESWQQDESRQGVEVMMLHRDKREHVCLERWAAGLILELGASDGLELLVLDGGFEDSREQLFRKECSSMLTTGTVKR